LVGLRAKPALDQKNMQPGWEMQLRRKEATMLWTIFVILLVLWVLGLLTGYTLGGIIHALLVIAIIVLLVQVFQGRRRL